MQQIVGERPSMVGSAIGSASLGGRDGAGRYGDKDMYGNRRLSSTRLTKSGSAGTLSASTNF